MLSVLRWHRPVARFLAALLVFAGSFQLVVHSAPRGSVLAEICTAGGSVLRLGDVTPGDIPASGSVPGTCLLCLAACQAWAAGAEANRAPVDLPGAVASLHVPQVVPTAPPRWRHPSRGPPASA